MTPIEKANELYQEGVMAFRSGNNKQCIILTNKSLEIGRFLGDDQIVGQALMGLCRVALRNHDENHLSSLSEALLDLATRTGDDWWRVVMAHMNAEMARMNGDFDRANLLYDQSMSLSEAIGSANMVATECLNKSFVAVAQGRRETANELLLRHFSIRKELDDDEIDPYGLIGLANLLLAEGKVLDAAETAYVCRRLLANKEIMPDPADEIPLKNVEKRCGEELSPQIQEQLLESSETESCLSLVCRYFSL